MASGWANDDAVNEQINSTIEDAVARARGEIPRGESLTECAVHQNGIGCEQTAEQDAVAHQVDPETEDFRRSCIMVRMFMRVGS